MVVQASVAKTGYGTGRPNPIDVHVGSRVRLRRTLLGMSQEKLGDAIGLTFQQVQKYERGANRIGSSRLFDLSRVLDVPVSFFFDDMPAEISESTPGSDSGLSETSADSYASDPLAKRETLELVRNYVAAPADVQQKFLSLVKSIANSASSS